MSKARLKQQAVRPKPLSTRIRLAYLGRNRTFHRNKTCEDIMLDLHYKIQTSRNVINHTSRSRVRRYSRFMHDVTLL